MDLSVATFGAVALQNMNGPDRTRRGGVRHISPKTFPALLAGGRARQSTIAAVLAEAFGANGVWPGSWTEETLGTLNAIWAATTSTEWEATRPQVAGARLFALEIVRREYRADGSATSEIRPIENPDRVVLDALLVAYFGHSHDLKFLKDPGVEALHTYLFLSEIVRSLKGKLIAADPSESHPLDELIACKVELELVGIALNAIPRQNVNARRRKAKCFEPWLSSYAGIVKQWPQLLPVVLNALTASSLLRRREDYEGLTFDLFVATRLERYGCEDRDCPKALVAQASAHLEDWRDDDHPGSAAGRDGDLNDYDSWFKADLKDRQKLAAKAIQHVRRRRHRQSSTARPTPRPTTFLSTVVIMLVLAFAITRFGFESPSVEIDTMRQAADTPESLPIDAPAVPPEDDGGFQIADIGLMIRLADIGLMGSITLA